MGNIKPLLRLKSLEDTSLIRKFSVLFVVMSLLPFVIIAYLYTQFGNSSSIHISQGAMVWLIFFSGIGLLVGFLLMRRSLMQIQGIVKKTRSVLAINTKQDPADDVGEENEISQLVKSFNEVTKSLELNIKRLEASKRTMQDVLAKLATGLSQSESIDTFLDLILEITTQALDAKIGLLMLLDEDKQELYVQAGAGVSKQNMSLRIKVGEDSPGWVAKNKQPLLIPELVSLKKTDAAEKDLVQNPLEPPLMCTPMIYQNKLVGVFSVSGKIGGGNFQNDELVIMSNLATQTAIAVENERLHIDAEKTYLGTISALAMAVEARDIYSRGHSDRVSQYSALLAQKMGLSPDLIKDITAAAQLHDVGKIGISDEILRKPSGLSADETAIMSRHPVIGEGIVKPVRSLYRLCPIIRHHHEWLDGTGYPDGLVGDDIPLAARILTVTDTYDAMTTDRPYRKGLDPLRAREELKKFAGTRYDPEVINAFLELKL